MNGLEDFFIHLASQLGLTDTEEETITRSYRAVGAFLVDSETLKEYAPNVFPQGSMRIGTTIKPLKRDDYDIDLVCELTKSTGQLSPKEVKSLVGKALKNGRYGSQLQKEHGRCWTLEYNASPPYHLDILPGIGVAGDRVKATKKGKDGVYSWLPTNPKGFAQWFLSRFRTSRVLDEKGAVENPPRNERRNALQKAVQLLKRHRDVYFRNRSEDGPASIIITALSGLSYHDETSVEDILRNGPITWVSHIKMANNRYVIQIPGLSDDNYADKWNGEDKGAADLFFEWHAKLLLDLDTLLAQKDLESFVKVAKRMFDDGIVDQVLNQYPETRKALASSLKPILPMTLDVCHPLFRHARSIASDRHSYIPRKDVRLVIKGRAFRSESERKKNSESECLCQFEHYSPLLSKNLFLRFIALPTNAPKRFYLRWQITNTGEEAKDNGIECLRGGFENSQEGISCNKFECTSYSGTHFVQAFLIDSSTGNCVAKSNILTINIEGK